jgi:hypothetical protein
MKKLTFVLITFLLVTACTNEVTVDEDNWPEKLIVTGSAYSIFITDFAEYFDSLPSDHSSILSNYLNSKKDEDKKTSNGQRGIAGDDGATCNCLPGQTECRSDTYLTSCCICCSGGASAVCSTTGPFSSCKCNEKDKTSGRENENEVPVIIYPRRFKDLFIFAESKEITSEPLKTSLLKLMRSAK